MSDGLELTPSAGPRSTLTETLASGPLPLHQLTPWRERGIVAGITGRGSGPSRGYDLGLWTDAPVGEVMNRWRGFREAMVGFDAVVLGHQVHGSVVETIGPARGWVQIEGVDGWVTTTPGVLLTVTVADCIPVYLAVPGRGTALLHAGWRGTAGGIVGVGLSCLLERTNASPADVLMHCGVGICGACYEVGREVMNGCGVPAEGAGPWHLDLRAHLATVAAGLGVKSISVSSWCSAHDRASFYSHRASGGSDGRMVAYAGMPRTD
ncbi:MAG TPA: polyphenol oxidase family protein [Gemmatimonadales bacterium]|nr:polyphenol oxidase family protein [Gemmatimonadales bacterium]